MRKAGSCPVAGCSRDSTRWTDHLQAAEPGHPCCGTSCAHRQARVDAHAAPRLCDPPV